MVSSKQLHRSMRAAWRGICTVAREEQSFRVQLLAALGVASLIVVMDLAVWESVALSMMAILVLVLEIVNTVFERIIDLLTPRLASYVGVIKDMLAGAVLIASIGSLITAGFILWPHIVAQ